MGGIVSAITGSGARKAGNTQAASAEQAAALQKEIYNQQRSDFRPYRSAGGAALSDLAMMTLGYDPTTQPQSMSSLQYNPMEQYQAAAKGGKITPQLQAFLMDFAGIPSNVGSTFKSAKLLPMLESALPAIQKYGSMQPQGGGFSPIKQFGTPTQGQPQAGTSLASLAMGQQGSAPTMYSAQNRAPTDVRMAGFMASPNYQFRLSEGQKALERSAAARGGLLSGAQLKAAQGFGQNLASDEYNNYLNQVASLAGIGQSSTAQTAAAAQNYGAQGAQQINNAGAARGSAYAAGQMAGQQLLGNLATGLGSAYGMGWFK